MCPHEPVRANRASSPTHDARAASVAIDPSIPARARVEGPFFHPPIDRRVHRARPTRRRVSRSTHARARCPTTNHHPCPHSTRPSVAQLNPPPRLDVAELCDPLRRASPRHARRDDTTGTAMDAREREKNDARRRPSSRRRPRRRATTTGPRGRTSSRCTQDVRPFLLSSCVLLVEISRFEVCDSRMSPRGRPTPRCARVDARHSFARATDAVCASTARRPRESTDSFSFEWARR